MILEKRSDPGRPSRPDARDNRAALTERFKSVRARTEALAAPLCTEDQQLQSMPLTSPTKWHRAHTTWFFETFILRPAGHNAHDARFDTLFNSYYESIGERVARDMRGLLSRPTGEQIGDYRRAVDERVIEHIRSCNEPAIRQLESIMDVGIAHEEQHQELILTDILHAFFHNPLFPAYQSASGFDAVTSVRADASQRWHSFSGGLVEIGAGEDGFCFDNEHPRHQVFLKDYALSSRTVSVGDVKSFIAQRGYQTPALWLSQGYETARALDWQAPLYACNDSDGYRVFTLRGWHYPHDEEPASHLSYWEADAIARFLGARLPTEAEWEHGARTEACDVGNFADGSGAPLFPGGACESSDLDHLFGNVWEWTRSSHDPYPGYTPPAGALGEYNGKFMAQQMVLRGSSCLTPRNHMRASYRNFWHPDTRFQMSGVRLARDL